MDDRSGPCLLRALTRADDNGDLNFQRFFGETQAQYQNNPQTWIITGGSCGSRVRCTSCSTAAGCGSAVSSAIDNGVVQFWAETPVQFGAGNLPQSTPQNTLGTATRPISLAGTSALKLTANITAYGMFFVATATATADATYVGSGAAKIYGSFVSRGDFVKGAGTLDLISTPISSVSARAPGCSSACREAGATRKRRTRRAHPIGRLETITMTTRPSTQAGRQAGFTLLEALIALLVTSFGMLARWMQETGEG